MGKNAGTVLGSILSATGFGLPIGIPLIAADVAQGGDLLAPPELPEPPKNTGAEADYEAARAAEAERRRASQTKNKLAPKVSEALSATTAKTALGGTR